MITKFDPGDFSLVAHASLPGDVSIWSWQSVWCQPAGQHQGHVPSHLSAPCLRAAMHLASWCPCVSPLKEVGTAPLPGLAPGPRRPKSRLAACAPPCLQLTARRSAGWAGWGVGPPPPVKAIAVTGVPPASSVQLWFCRFLRRGRRFSHCEVSGHLGIQVIPAGPSVTPPLTVCALGGRSQTLPPLHTRDPSGRRAEVTAP